MIPSETPVLPVPKYREGSAKPCLNMVAILISHWANYSISTFSVYKDAKDTGSLKLRTNWTPLKCQ